jgi:hypothetical protein
MPHSCGNFSFDKKVSIMTIRGGVSTDKHLRKEGIDWFPGEEMTIPEWDSCIKAYRKWRPEIVASHTCPEVAREWLFKINIPELTPNRMEDCFSYHQPRIWIFGHHHESRDEVIEGTRFICLDELETLVV